MLGIVVGPTATSDDAKEDPVLVAAPIARPNNYGQNGEREMILAGEEIHAADSVNVDGIKRSLELVITDTNRKNLRSAPFKTRKRGLS